LITIALTFITVLLLYHFNILECELLGSNEATELYWNIINFSALLAGFMFTTLGVIMGVTISDTIAKIVKKFEKTSILDHMFLNIVVGVVSCLVTIVFFLVIILSSAKLQGKFSGTTSQFTIAVITTLIFYSLICFLKSITDFWFLIKIIGKEILSKRMSEDSINEVLKKIK